MQRWISATMGSLLLATAGAWWMARARVQGGALAEAERAVEVQQWVRAARAIDRYAAWGGSGETAEALRTQLAYQDQQWETVLARSDQVSARHPRWPITQLCRADALLRLDRAGDAESTLRQCLVAEPSALEPRRALVHICRWEDRKSEARRLLDELYELGPPAERFRVLAERFVVDYGQYTHELAKGRLALWVRNCPEDLEAKVALARRLTDDGDLAAAVPMLQASVKQQPDHEEGRRALVAALIKQGQSTRARAELDAWPESKRATAYWEVQGHWLQECAGRFDDAIAAFRKVLNENPDDWQTRHRLGTCLRLAKQESAGRVELERAKAIREMVRFDVVQRLIHESLPRLPRSEECERIAAFYDAVGRGDQAARWYKLILQYEPRHAAATESLQRLPSRRAEMQKPAASAQDPK
jgi:tetratricopeptide (TPR) repeat protein